MAFSIKDLLGDAVFRARIGKEVMLARTIESANAHLSTLLPAGHADDARAISLKEGVVTIACKNPSATHLISTKKYDILSAIKRDVPESTAARIHTRLTDEYRSQHVVE